jgi:hypothetical protein
MARAGHVVFFAPLLVPLAAMVRFFVGTGGFHGVPESSVGAGVAFAALALAGALVLSVLRAARPASAGELSLRALLVTPATAIAALFVTVVTVELTARFVARPEAEESASAPAPSDDVPLAIDHEGHIGRRRRGRELSMYRVDPLDRIEPRQEGRLWTPSLSTRTLQIFRERERNVFAAYRTHTGEHLGCLGRDGLGSCTDFAGPPVVVHAGDGGVIITEGSVDYVDGDGRVAQLLQGDVRGGVGMGWLDNGDDAIAIAVDDDVSLVRVGPRDIGGDPEAPEEEAPPEVGPAPSVAVVCRDLVGDGQRVDGIAIGDDFVATRLVLDADPSAIELAVCRDGEVTERATFRDARWAGVTTPRRRDQVLTRWQGPCCRACAPSSRTAPIRRRWRPS